MSIDQATGLAWELQFVHLDGPDSEQQDESAYEHAFLTGVLKKSFDEGVGPVSTAQTVPLEESEPVPTTLRPSGDTATAPTSSAVPHNFAGEHHLSSSLRRPKCPTCSQSFSKQTSVLRHQRTAHKESVGRVQAVLTYCCPQCGRKFARKDYRDRHLRCQHTKTRVNCDICGKQIAPRSLSEHQTSRYCLWQYVQQSLWLRSTRGDTDDRCNLSGLSTYSPSTFAKLVDPQQVSRKLFGPLQNGGHMLFGIAFRLSLLSDIKFECQVPMASMTSQPDETEVLSLKAVAHGVVRQLLLRGCIGSELLAWTSLLVCITSSAGQWQEAGVHFNGLRQMHHKLQDAGRCPLREIFPHGCCFDFVGECDVRSPHDDGETDTDSEAGTDSDFSDSDNDFATSDERLDDAKDDTNEQVPLADSSLQIQLNAAQRPGLGASLHGALLSIIPKMYDLMNRRPQVGKLLLDYQASADVHGVASALTMLEESVGDLDKNLSEEMESFAIRIVEYATEARIMWARPLAENPLAFAEVCEYYSVTLDILMLAVRKLGAELIHLLTRFRAYISLLLALEEKYGAEPDPDKEEAASELIMLERQLISRWIAAPPQEALWRRSTGGLEEMNGMAFPYQF